jgi:hypothetical protein
MVMDVIVVVDPSFATSSSNIGRSLQHLTKDSWNFGLYLPVAVTPFCDVRSIVEPFQKYDFSSHNLEPDLV